MEAEDGVIVNRSQSWIPQTSVAGYSGTAYLTALPNAGVNLDATTNAEVQFRVKFATTGTYYVWVRGYATGPADDSVNVGIDGAAARFRQVALAVPQRDAGLGVVQHEDGQRGPRDGRRRPRRRAHDQRLDARGRLLASTRSC